MSPGDAHLCFKHSLHVYTHLQIHTPAAQSANKCGPPSARQRNAIRMAFRWRADSGPRLYPG